MTIPRNFIDAYTSHINTLSSRSQTTLKKMLARVDFDQDVATVRAQVVEIMQSVCGASTDAASLLSSEFYDGLREYELGEKMGAVAESGRDPKATEGAVRAFADFLVKDNKQSFIGRLLDRVDYEIKVAASQTCLNNAKRDKRKPKFARVPSGSETCDFCLMLASRGFVYHTEAAASHAHANCDCRVVPSWESHAVEGYDTREIYNRWQDAIDSKAEQRAERNGTSAGEERKRIMAAYAASSRATRQRAKKR